MAKLPSEDDMTPFLKQMIAAELDAVWASLPRDTDDCLSIADFKAHASGQFLEGSDFDRSQMPDLDKLIEEKLGKDLQRLTREQVCTGLQELMGIVMNSMA